MSSPDVIAWLDQDQPHDALRSEAQISGLLARLGPSPRRVLELGCGGGRVLLPLVDAGHAVVGIDHDPAAIARCRSGDHDHQPMLIEQDFLRDGWMDAAVGGAGEFDAVLLLGNTLMTIWDVDAAVRLFSDVRGLLRPDGWLAVDDIPHDLWPLLAEGAWVSGLSEQEDDHEPSEPMQLVWAPDDAVFALRVGDRIDPNRWTFTQDEQRYRLWTMGTLTLAARLAGLSAPIHDSEAGLLLMTAVNGA